MMSNNPATGSGTAYRESLRKYYDDLMREAEAENRKREDELQRELMTEDPLNVNYARWATEEEFKKDLIEVSLEDCTVDRSGIPLLCSGSSAYVDASDSHSLIIGSSGSKKTRLFILPSILSLAKAGESMVITDPKAELYERTSGYLKKKGYKVYCVNFRDESVNNAWNPLEAPLKFFKRGKFDVSVGLLNDFATISIPKDTRGIDPFWDDSARSGFMGLLLILFILAEDETEVNIRSLLRLRATVFNNKADGDFALKKIIECAGVDSLVTTYLSGLSIAPEKTYSSILSTLDNHLMKFVIRPSLTDMLCHNDIKFSDIGQEKTAIFLVMPDEKETYHGLISIFIQQCYESLIFEAQKCEKRALPIRVNFLLDEFSSLPQIKEFPSMIAAARSRNIRFNIVVQSEKQLRSRYSEEADTIKGNCNNWIYLYSREYPTLVEISNLCGAQKSGKPLVTTSRLQRLDKDKGEVLIMHGRKYPFMSFLKDINEYDHDKPSKPYHEKGSGDEGIRLFDIIAYLKTMGWEYAQNRLRRNESTASTQITKYTPKLCVNDLFNHSVDESNDIYIASTLWHQRNIYLFSRNETVLPVDMSFEILESKDNTLFTRSPLSIKALPDVIELSNDNVAIINTDPDSLGRLSKDLFSQLLFRKKLIPLYFDFRNFNIPDVLDDEEKRLSLLPLLLTKQLYDIPIDGDSFHDSTILMDKYTQLMHYFDEDNKGIKEFVVIIYALEESSFLSEAIYQSWELGARKNVKIVVLSTNAESILDVNCAKFYSIKDDSKKMYTKPMIYFDELTNEVCIKQKPSPKFRISISTPRNVTVKTN
ncbi:MAG: type IV secretory system conjugative DNA transfer family protein [Paludibacteraceae bacterium]|nr:type IV secretory system conjugative DNA transfer family protein [Paludibacteraceae bacterium]